jgi:uncharacterized protein (DUF2141 family)
MQSITLLIAVQTLLHAAPAPSTSNATGRIELEVRSLRNSKGAVLVNLYQHEAGFPQDASKAARVSRVAAKMEGTHIVLPGIPPGTYALAVCHDENNNGDCDTNFLGIPKEGVAVSRDAKGFMGPPKFCDAKFVVGYKPVKLRVHIDY